MDKHRNAERKQLLLENVCRILTAVLCDNDRADIKTDAPEKVNKAQNLHIV